MHLMGPKLMPIFKNRDLGIGEWDRRLGIEEFLTCVLYFANMSMKE